MIRGQERAQQVRRNRPSVPSAAWVRDHPLWLVILALSTVSYSGFGQNLLPETSKPAVVRGTVHTPSGQAISGATVVLQQGTSKPITASTEADGTFRLSYAPDGSFRLKVDKPGFCTLLVDSSQWTAGQAVDLAMVPADSTHGCVSEPSRGPKMQVELNDQPSFAIAGVTDWGGAGGHGSDATLRASEALARQASDLKPADTLRKSAEASNEAELRAALAREPQSFEFNSRLGNLYLRTQRAAEAIPLLEAANKIKPHDQAHAYALAAAYKAAGYLAQAREQIASILANHENADAHRLLGDVNELQNNPLEAVREYERAARLDPSEQNYFNWGTELLLHRAVQPAMEVFTKGAAVHPGSARLLAGLGAALYSRGSYDEAAYRVCQAVDLAPSESDPYLFLGIMEKGAPQPLPCAREKLAALVQQQPENALGHYYYAVSLWKTARRTASAPDLQRIEELLRRAVDLNPKLGPAYLQLGMVYFAQKDVHNAVAAYEKAVEADPNLSEAHYQLGLCYKQLGETSRAQREFQAYSQTSRANSEAVERQRREVRQFLIVLADRPAASSQQ